jgi:hypothetical protein
MSQPQWITAPGNLGTIPEGEFWEQRLQAVATGQDVFFRLIAGQPPSGVQITTNGIIEGVPRNLVSVRGVPQEVSEDVTSRFAIRAYTQKIVDGATVVDRFADRTFTITVTGQTIPTFITPAGEIAQFYDGSPVDLQILFSDPDPGDSITMRIIAGALPPGLTLDARTGKISGVIQPFVGPPGTATPGYDATQYDEFEFDFTTRAQSKNFQFTLEITDGKSSNVRTYDIFVVAKDTLTADTVDYTADDTFITADVTPVRPPVLLTPAGNIGRYRSDNFFAFRFLAEDFDLDPVVFDLLPGLAVPPNLVLDPVTGWLNGYILDQGATEQNYRFAVRARKSGSSPVVASAYKFYDIDIIGDIDSEVVWISAPDLGIINNGAVSTFQVQAQSRDLIPLRYRIVSGSNSRLPQGLTLRESGEIQGRVSFNTFCLDGGSTTFDVNLNPRLGIVNTTFDLVFRFTVNAFAVNTETQGYSVASIVILSGGQGYVSPVSVSISPPPLSELTRAARVGIENSFTGDGSTTVFTLSEEASTDLVQVNVDGIPLIASVDFTVSANQLILISAPVNFAEIAVKILDTPSAVTTVGGVITAINIVDSGLGYVTPPTVTITGSGVGATAVVEVQGSSPNLVSVFRRFTITVDRVFDEPYQTLYIKAMPSEHDRALLATLLADDDSSDVPIPRDLVYRPNDPNFGVSTSVVYDHAYGLAARALDEYVAALDLNHYWRNLTLGPIRTAQALDSQGRVIYEVVYSEIIDNLVNQQGQSVGKAVLLPYDVIDPRDQSTELSVVYPNSLPNMRDQVIDTVGQVSPALPLWMTSKQPNGNVLGFVPAWVIAYVLPDQSGRVAYNIQQRITFDLNVINYKVDRYELDRSQTPNWDPSTEKFEPFPPLATTFDLLGSFAGIGPVEVQDIFTGDGTTTDFPLSAKTSSAHIEVRLDGTLQILGTNYVFIDSTDTVRFDDAPAPGSDVTVSITISTVDLATSLPFSGVNGRTLSEIAAQGGIDGQLGRIIDGKTLIFLKQENFDGLTPDEAFTDYIYPYDSAEQNNDPGSYDQDEFDTAVILTTEQRLSIYRVSIDSEDIVHLSLDAVTQTNNSVTVELGTNNAGKNLYVPSSPGPGELLLSWRVVPLVTGDPTIFDGGATYFAAPADRWIATDEYDKYLVFPKQTILG